jgi:hypothetical protein
MDGRCEYIGQAKRGGPPVGGFGVRLTTPSGKE